MDEGMREWSCKWMNNEHRNGGKNHEGIIEGINEWGDEWMKINVLTNYNEMYMIIVIMKFVHARIFDYKFRSIIHISISVYIS